jgi:Domain of unknown function (DUF5753)/Helix-turn-helix domain
MEGTEMTESRVPRRVLGWHLRELRQQARLPVRVAAGALEWSEPKLWRVETGQTALRGLDVEALCRLYGASSSVTCALAGLARQSRAGGWWRAYGEGIPEGFSVYAGLEEMASELLVYAPALVPPLMRTEAYERTLIMTSRPDAGAGEVDRLVGECLARQVLLTRVCEPLAVTVVLSEALACCPVGGPAVMAEQLRHLAGLAVLPNVCVRVVPFRVGAHPGMLARPFTLLRFPASGRAGEADDPGTVYVGGLTGELYLDQPHEVQRHHEVFGAVLERSLEWHASQSMLLAVAKELEQATG